MDNNLPKTDPSGNQNPFPQNSSTHQDSSQQNPSLNQPQTNWNPSSPSTPEPSNPSSFPTSPQPPFNSSFSNPQETSTQNPPPPSNNNSSSLFLPDGHEMHNNHGSAIKIIIGILIVGLILLAGGFFILAQQNTQTQTASISTPTQPPTLTTNPTANWLSYTDSETGFSIQYPPTGSFTTGKPYFGTNGTEEIPKAFTIDDAVLTILPNFRENTFTPVSNEIILVGGIQTEKNYESSTSAVIKAIPISSDTTVAFTYKLPDDPTKAQIINKLFDQILTTFAINATQSSQLLNQEDAMMMEKSSTSPSTPVQ